MCRFKDTNLGIKKLDFSEKRELLIRFLWKLLTALIAAFGGAASASAAIGFGIL